LACSYQIANLAAKAVGYFHGDREIIVDYLLDFFASI